MGLLREIGWCAKAALPNTAGWSTSFTAISGGAIVLCGWCAPIPTGEFLDRARLVYPFFPNASNAVNAAILALACFGVVYFVRLVFLAPYWRILELSAKIAAETPVRELHESAQEAKQKRHDERMESDRKTRNLTRGAEARKLGLAVRLPALKDQ